MTQDLLFGRRRALAQARTRLGHAMRGYFFERGFEEVETPLLVPFPGMELHIRAFEVPFHPETPEGRDATLYLHTSPEYAMKRLLAEGFERIFQLCKVFRDGEIARLHNPEFTMLEFYRANADYHAIMEDVEELVVRGAIAVAGAADGRGPESVSAPSAVVDGREVPLVRPFERLTFRQALISRTGIDHTRFIEADALRREARARGYMLPGDDGTYDEVLLQLFLTAVEPTLGLERPTFLIEYPASMASLARLKPDDPTVAERVELFIGGTELANGFSELVDAAEQRARLVAEQEERRALGRPVYPLDERFLDAVGRMPPSAGIALGFDRLLMLLAGVERIDELLLFPARGYFA